MTGVAYQLAASCGPSRSNSPQHLLPQRVSRHTLAPWLASRWIEADNDYYQSCIDNRICIRICFSVVLRLLKQLTLRVVRSNHGGAKIVLQLFDFVLPAHLPCNYRTFLWMGISGKVIHLVRSTHSVAVKLKGKSLPS